MGIRIKDTVWIQHSFLIPDSALDEVDKRRRVLTSAAFKFTDTTLGGNFAINAPPQFTRYADIRVGGSEAYSRGDARTGSTTPGGVRWMMSTGQYMAQTENPNAKYTSPSAGMGRYYSESIDDWGQDLVMRFGVPEYNSLMQFFGNFYDSSAAALARAGRTFELFATAGRAIGFLIALPLQPLILGGQWVRFMGNWPVSKYYYMKPTMYPYWEAVNTIANGIAVNMGIIPMGLTEAQREPFGVDEGYLADQQTFMEDYAKVLPDIFLSADGRAAGIDVYKVANRAQRIANTYNTKLIAKLDQMDSASDLSDAVNAFRDEMFVNGGLKHAPSEGIDKYRERYLNMSRNRIGADTTYITLAGDAAPTDTADADGSLETMNTPTDPSKLDVEVESVNAEGRRPWYDMGGFDGSTNNTDGEKSWFGEARAMFEGERRDGAQFVTFRVQYSGTTGEDFSNSVEEPQIAQKFNSTSSSARSARFDMANGNFADVPIIGNLVSSVVGAAKSLLTNTLDGMHMSGLIALAGNAFVDIPKTWSGSTANLPKAQYTIKLRSPYGSRMSRMMNLYIPLSMLLAAALPLSTGKRSYTSPFICEAFCRGRHAIRLGIIESMSISRGEGNVGWTPEGEALGIDVTFTIADLSSIMHLPIMANFGTTDKAIQAVANGISAASGGLISGASASEAATYFQKGTYDDDNSFTDYMAVLGSLSWQDLTYANRRWRLARYRQMQNWTSWKSPAHASMWFGSTMIGRVINVFSTETDRPD